MSLRETDLIKIKRLFLFFSFNLVVSCQYISIEPAAVDPSLKVENGYGDCSFLEYPTYIINKDYVIYQDCSTHKIIDADVTSFTIKTSGREGFAFDKNGVFVKGKQVRIDTAGFTVLPDNPERDLCWKTGTKFFKNTTEVNKAVLNILQNNPGRKSKTALSNDDSNKIVIDYNFYKKDNHVYYRGKQTNFDAETFTQIDKSHLYYRDKDVVFYLDNLKGGIQKLKDVDPNSARVFNNFLTDKNYLYHENIKIIKSKEVELLAIFPGYRKGCGLDPEPGSDFYLFKNTEGFWLVKISDKISYRFLGKVFDRKWDQAFDVIDLHKKYGNTRINLPIQPAEKALKETENQIYNIAAVDVRPEYPGGIEKLYDFFKTNYIVPEYVIKNNIKKLRIYTNFVIEKDGTLSEIKVLYDPGYNSAKELLRVLKLAPHWKPATIDGKPVRCLYSTRFNIN
ncbi:DKNYY domain-containing protein [Flavobacterium panacagri]|uniref:DKNYY domain-containing protein n=1 Tax=Flavobacterium panacagri TaxID=3034146 RepID=UPI0025A67C0B|nr:DKNYY domain-containing protein [Flavobacterium panacagri]